MNTNNKKVKVSEHGLAEPYDDDILANTLANLNISDKMVDPVYKLGVSLVTGLARVDKNIETLAETFKDMGLRDELLDVFQDSGGGGGTWFGGWTSMIF